MASTVKEKWSCPGCGITSDTQFQQCPDCGNSKPAIRRYHCVTHGDLEGARCLACERLNSRVERLTTAKLALTRQQWRKAISLCDGLDAESRGFAGVEDIRRQALAEERREREAKRAAAERRAEARRIFIRTWAPRLVKLAILLVIGWACVKGVDHYRFAKKRTAFNLALSQGRGDNALDLASGLEARHEPARALVLAHTQAMAVRDQAKVARSGYRPDVPGDGKEQSLAAETSWETGEKLCGSGDFKGACIQFESSKKAWSEAEQVAVVVVAERKAQRQKAIEIAEAASKEGLAALATRDWTGAQAAFSRALTEPSFPDRQVAEEGLRKARVGPLVATAEAARDEGLAALAARDWTKAAAAFARALAEPSFSDREVAADGAKKARAGAVIAAGAARDEGVSALAGRDWAKAEAAFVRALAEPSFTERQVAEEGIKKARLGAILTAAESARDEGVSALASHDWAKAEVAFDRALAEPSFSDRQVAEDGLKKARLGVLMVAAEAARDEGVSALVGHDWAKAEAAFVRALAEPSFTDRQVAEDGLKKARIGELLAAAAKADTRDWQSIEKFVDGILQLDPQNSDAKKLLADAQTQFPCVTVRAFAGDKEVSGAFIIVNGAEQKERTPATVRMEKGVIYSVSVSVANKADGKAFFPFETTYTAEGNGLQELKAMLVELKTRLAAGFRVAAGTKPEPYTKSGWPLAIVHAETGIELVYIPRGKFMMGSPKAESERMDDETKHRVTLSRGFYMGKYEVTQRQWQAVMGNNPAMFKNAGKDAPVEQVSWDDCQAFCLKLGPSFRLPTEAEWEYACRAGTTGAYAGNLDAMGWYVANSGGSTHPVGLNKANSWGLCDMLGNVYEWCQDLYGAYPTGSVTEPAGAASGAGRVIRGGSWRSFGGYCRSAARNNYAPSDRSSGIGFRVLVAAPAE